MIVGSNGGGGRAVGVLQVNSVYSIDIHVIPGHVVLSNIVLKQTVQVDFVRVP
jgi:hypothetical protein